MTDALLDVNIVLDYVLARAPYLAEATAIWEAAARHEYTGYVAAITPPTVFYIVRRERGRAAARLAIERILAGLQICPVSEPVLRDALLLPFTDFEDAVQYASAVAASIDVIVTRDLNDCRGAALSVLSPAEFITQHLSV
ncbi:MAG TPA: PIN domain-containing protein [Dehalococcoidia bacterium]|nr:PIN domain-containing protein [Dehalococcoidia bacterium]